MIAADRTHHQVADLPEARALPAVDVVRTYKRHLSEVLLTEVIVRLDHLGSPLATAMHGLWKDLGQDIWGRRILNLDLDVHNLYVSQELTLHTKLAP